MKKKVVATKKSAAKKQVPSTAAVSKPKNKKKEVASVYTSVKQALFAFQNENIVLPRNGQGKSMNGKVYKYVTLDDLISIVIPKLQQYRLGFSQAVQNEKLITELFHADSDTSIVSEIMLGKPENMQDYGTRITYARRYALTAITGVSAEEDVDASGSTEKPVVAPTAAAPAGVVADALKKAPEQKSAIEASKEEPQFNGLGAQSISKDKKAPIDTSFIKPATSAEKSADTPNLDARVEELTKSSEWFAKARTAIESAGNPDALVILEGQVESSKKATAEEKTFCAVLIKSAKEKFAK